MAAYFNACVVTTALHKSKNKSKNIFFRRFCTFDIISGEELIWVNRVQEWPAVYGAASQKWNCGPWAIGPMFYAF